MTGANGAAMRNLPVALVNVNREDCMITDSFLNAIITHGHPTAILGAILFGLIIRHILITQDTDLKRMIDYLLSSSKRSWSVASRDPRILDWVSSWEKFGKTHNQKFENFYMKSLSDGI